MFLGQDVVLYILGCLFIVYVIFIRLIVLCSHCRVNWGTNLSVVYHYVYFVIASTVHGLGLRVRRSQPVGRIPAEL